MHAHGSGTPYLSHREEVVQDACLQLEPRLVEGVCTGGMMEPGQGGGYVGTLSSQARANTGMHRC